MAKVVAQSTGDVLVFVFQDNTILDERTVTDVSSTLNKCIDSSEHEKVILDLGRVHLMTSAMLGELVKFKKRCEELKIDLRICGLSDEIGEVFKITRMDKLFKIYETREKALKSFGSHGLFG